ncbi:MAG TPA: succinate dehydrogenase cytochrome b subunit [Oligoflexia bacterium]|nr:succinate dehydrogenase cytochrome b subunit [Oligoflexia bacterium]HMR24718.1 succinate dehydrogenase cytochrome b subunit [Oligoflexia bacterium]
MMKNLGLLHCRLWKFYQSSVGKKWVVAITGIVMVLWLVGHMLGNLQIFAGPGSSPEETMINQYAALLKQNIVLLWLVRIVMLKMVILHIITTIALTKQNKAARPVGYLKNTPTKASFASRTMIYGGVFLLFYIIYHLGHFTLGMVHSSLLDHHDLYGSMIRSFQQPLIVALYLAAVFFLGLHLHHGIQSTVKTLGLSHPFYLNFAKAGGILLAFIVSIGFASIPIAVILGCIS